MQQSTLLWTRYVISNKLVTDSSHLEPQHAASELVMVSMFPHGGCDCFVPLTCSLSQVRHAYLDLCIRDRQLLITTLTTTHRSKLSVV